MSEIVGQSPEFDKTMEWLISDDPNGLTLHLNDTHLTHIDGFIDDKGRTFGQKRNGYVSFTDLSSWFLGQQSQYSSRYVDGFLKGYPSLKDGLPEYAIKDSSADYHSMGVHPDFCEEMMNRIQAYRMIQTSRYTKSGDFFEASDDQVSAAVDFLKARGFTFYDQD